MNFIKYNHLCVSDEMRSNFIELGNKFGVRRSTQEAEEVPLLRV